jgi:cell filamentation protein
MPADSSGIDPHFDYEHGVLRNVPGLTDQAKLDRFEAAEAGEALVRLHAKPIKGAFDRVHLKEIHACIFQRIYPWVGEFRTVNMHRPASYPFAMVQFMERNLNITFAKLAEESHLKGLDTRSFASRAAHYLGELNSIHPFREGNGRNGSSFGSWLLRWATASTGDTWRASKCTRHRSKVATWARIPPLQLLSSPLLSLNGSTDLCPRPYVIYPQ